MLKKPWVGHRLTAFEIVAGAGGFHGGSRSGRDRFGTQPRSDTVKYIIVTGGVISSLGKGIAATSLGLLLKQRGLKVTIQKMDPYINVDPGTMSPFQHGEVFVTEDGAETDLDLGHYERFLDVDLTRNHSVSTGQIYQAVINRERRGGYLGKTVQVIPHITDEIKARIREIGETDNPPDVIIVEIGGTTGDIESQPFLEAARQLRLEVGPGDCIFIHLTLVPYIRAAKELKTKPTQNSVRQLREIGIQPDVLMCRTEVPLNRDIRQKIALFCNVREEAVIEARDVASIYQVPIQFHKERLDEIVVEAPRSRRAGAGSHRVAGAAQADDRRRSARCRSPSAESTRILRDAYKSIIEAFTHAGIHNDVNVNVVWVDAEDIENHGAERYLAERLGDPRSRGVRGEGDSREARGDPLREGEQDPVPRDLSRSAERRHRVRAERVRHSRRGELGVQRQLSQPRDRSHGEPDARRRQGGDDEARGLPLQDQTGDARGRVLRESDGVGETPAPLGSQQQVPPDSSRSTVWFSRGRPRTIIWSRSSSCPIIRSSSPASSTPSSRAGPTAPIPLFKALVRAAKIHASESSIGAQRAINT